LSRRVDAVLAAPGFQNGHWGVLVVDRKTGETIYERNGDQLFAPASVTKLFSTAAALVELGPNHRFQTPLVRRGEVDLKGTLHGDVILIAQGDLCMGGRTGPDGTLVFNVPLDAPKPHRSISEATAAAGRLLGKLCEVLYLDSGDNVAPAAQAVAPTRNRSGSAR